MTAELILEDGGDRRHRQLFRELIDRSTGKIRIASPYVTEGDLLLGVKNRTIQVLTSLSLMDVVTGASSLAYLKALVEAGVKCRSVSDGPRLHAKVYLFGSDFAVVTSANLTTNALDFNIEAGACFTGSTAQKVSDWFDGMWTRGDQLDRPAIVKWQRETDELRKKYLKLREKAKQGATLPTERPDNVYSADDLEKLSHPDARCFVCNTNRRWSGKGVANDESAMREGRWAATWETFKYPEHMERVEPGSVILMFAKGAGVIGVGRATGKCQVLPPGAPGRLRRGVEYSTAEWRVPVNWAAWVDSDDEAYPWTMPNASFLDVSGQKYTKMRREVAAYFS